MTQESKIGKCQNCKECDCALETIIINNEEKEWCDSCRLGFLIESGKEENGNK